MNFFTEDNIKKGFSENDHYFLSEVYKMYYPTIKRFIISNAGSEEDAKDIFQESLMVVFQKVKNDDFYLSCAFLTYIYSIVKNMWLKELRTRKGSIVIVKDIDNLDESDCYIGFENENKLNAEYFIFRMHFKKLSQSCRVILRMFFDRVSYDEIAETLKLKSSGVVRKRKYRCKEKLIEMIKSDKQYLELNEK